MDFITNNAALADVPAVKNQNSGNPLAYVLHDLSARQDFCRSFLSGCFTGKRGFLEKMKEIKLREGLLFPILIAFLLFSMVAVISVGSASIDMGTVYRILVDQLFFQGKGTEAGLWEKSFYQIVWNIRLPRVLTCCGGLSICGAAMQALVLNPHRRTFILVSSGASAGAAWALLMPI